MSYTLKLHALQVQYVPRLALVGRGLAATSDRIGPIEITKAAVLAGDYHHHRPMCMCVCTFRVGADKQGKGIAGK